MGVAAILRPNSGTTVAAKILVLNGPGLADLGDYSGSWHGQLTLDGIRADCQAVCDELGLELDFRQTDNQDEMFRWIAKDSESFDGVVINPVGHSKGMMEVFELYRSAIQIIATLKKPVIEVHISNIFSQVEDVNQRLHEPEGDMGFVCGFGNFSYTLAIRAIHRKLATPATA